MALLTLSRGDRRLVDLPASWSNQGRDEQLQKAAAESFSNLVALAVAESGSNFQLYDALRPIEEQIALLKRNYRRVSRGRSKSSDRTWDGSTWEKRPGRPNTASPGYSNHGSGLAVDIHPGPIQEVFKAKGPAWGWSWAEGRRNGENWHFVYVGGNQYASRGWLDHAWVQKVVGVKADGKIGTGTVKAIKAWQKAHGLDADGIVGPGTKAAMLGKSVADVVEDVADKVSEIAKPVQAATDYTIERHQTKNLRVDRIDEKRGLVGKLNAITLHHWGSDGQSFDSVVGWLVADGNGNNQSSAHEVIEGGRVAILADMKDGTWNSGSAQGNVDNYALECRPEADAETVATVAARVAAIRAEAGVDLPLNIHSDYTATQCPGRYRDLLAEIDALARGGTVNLGRPVVTPSKPAVSGKLPTGKALLMAIIDAPDFPLLRTPGNLCYYGPAGGPIASVSGKNPNSLNPGEISGTGSKSKAQGLVTLQKRFVARGYSLDVDGRFGDQMDNAVRNLQKLAGLKVDGKAGPDTWHAAWVLPVQ